MVPARQISGPGLALLTAMEGLRLLPYRDSGGLWTVGVGHLVLPTESIPGLYYKQPSNLAGGISTGTAKLLLSSDLLKFESLISETVTVSLLQCEFDALTIFAFNVGESAFKTSALLKALNAVRSDKTAKDIAALHMLEWCHVSGVIVPALQLRQLKTVAFFCGWQSPVKQD